MITAEQLKSYKFFSKLSDHCLDEIASRVEEVEKPAGVEIIRQNTPADYFYFVKEGSVEITKRTKFGQSAIIEILDQGEGFGEMALLTCSHRHTNVIARTDVTLGRLSKKDFEEIIMTESSFHEMLESRSRQYQDYHSIKTLQPLALVEPEKMITLTHKMITRCYKTGENIITVDERGDFYYILKNGLAAVIKINGDSEKQVDTISPGQGFGEEALIRDQKRNATVRALEDCETLALDASDFHSILKKSFLEFTFPEDITEEEMAGYVFIDARIPAEYEEEHIAGAVNIPLEKLRQTFAELDPDQNYITYCTNDSRGMAAAFLMAAQGFKARNLRSGLSGWEGPVITPGEGVHYPSEVA